MNTDTAMIVAQIMGPFLLILSVAGLTHMKYMREVVKELGKNKWELLFLSGVRLLMWLLILTFYHSWTMDLYVMVTLVWWIAVVCGAGGLFFPEYTQKMLPVWNKHPNRIRSALVIWALLGLCVSYVGFFM